MKFLSIAHQSLAWKLVFSIGAVMIMIDVLFWYAFVRHEKEELILNTVRYSGSFAKLIKETTKFGMLTFNKENIQHSIDSIATLEDVKKIRMFNKRGVIAYSSEKREIGIKVNKDTKICQTCHLPSKKNIVTLELKEQWFIYNDLEKNRYLRFIEPIYNEPSCYVSACHAHSKEQKVLGLLEMDLTLSTVDRIIWSRTWKTISFGVLFFCLLSLALLFILWRLVSRPVSVLAASMKKVAEGDLDHPVYTYSNDEIALLARNFNEMIRELKRSRDTMNKWTQKLEEEVAKKTEEIQKTQSHLVQTEKLASLGRMAAGVAHELNNPLTGITTFAHLMLQRIPDENKDDKEDLAVIVEQAERCAKIIKGLLTFSRATQTEKGIINLVEVLVKTIDIVKSNEKFYNVQFDYPKSAPPLLVEGDPSQFQQVFLNMLINAADAMNEKGTLKIRTHSIKENETLWGEIIFTDTGTGISRKNIDKLFDPFFTTKPVGKGTGLGLAVSHGIIKHHGGRILVKSQVGVGTSFFIRVPLRYK